MLKPAYQVQHQLRVYLHVIDGALPPKPSCVFV